jgi:2-keto-4-pentenoate hydratase/2-oxohepta-3-ene-1,7-dioic acid hydratase in catechol pathway
MVGQDISARDVQMLGSPPQFSLGKSFPGFGPTGPWLATPDELHDPDDLAIGCALNGEQVQSDRTSSMLLSVPETVSRLSAICPLLPGDLIFTGTPAGVGNRMDPPRYLRAGDELVSTVEGVGSITTRFQ